MNAARHRNLLVGVLAVKRGLVTSAQLEEVAEQWEETEEGALPSDWLKPKRHHLNRTHIPGL